jgi:hypothetical protein
MREGKIRLTISLSPQMDDFLTARGGCRGKSAYLEDLLRTQAENTNNISRVVARVDDMTETSRLLKKLLAVAVQEVATQNGISEERMELGIVHYGKPPINEKCG